MRSPSWTIFPAVFSTVYTAVYAFGVPIVIYYPRAGRFFLDPQPPMAGPGMLYYGWVLTALLAAFLVALLVPPRWAERLPKSLCWLFPVAAMAYVLYHERVWLLP